MITCKVYEKFDLAFYACRGAITVDDCISNIQFIDKAKPRMKHLFDLTEADLSQLSGRHIVHIAQFRAKHGPNRDGTKMVIVSPEDEGYGLARMYEAYAQIAGQNTTIHVCRSINEALLWLKIDSTLQHISPTRSNKVRCFRKDQPVAQQATDS